MAKKKMDAAQVIEAIEQMTVLELSEMVRALEEKFGISAAAPVAVGVPVAGPGASAPAEEEKFEFDVLLKEVGPKKIQVIKVVRELTGLGLRESKEVVDNAPSAIHKAIPKDEAEAAKGKLEAEGAVVELQ
jgi:large subunit ribosomal protein L7/L12